MVTSLVKLWRLCDSLSDLHSSLRERRLVCTVLRPALLPVRTAQFTQIFRRVYKWKAADGTGKTGNSV
jgi:hypothetical protein